MSKHVGNVTNPFEMIDKYGADPVRCYMMTKDVYKRQDVIYYVIC